MSVDIKQVLQNQIAKRGTIKAVADALGVSRTQVSLYLSDRYQAVGGRADRLEERVIEVLLDQVACPHLSEALSKETCQANAAAAIPQSDPAALKLWFACKSCPNNPKANQPKEGAA